LDYFIFSEIKGNTTLSITKAPYEAFLKNLLNATDYTFKRENNIYLIGDRNLEGLRTSKVLSLKYRTVDKLIEFIPAELKKGLDIKVFNDLNSLILSGSQPRIDELERFMIQIDRVVPVVSIEVIVIEIKNSSAVAKGFSAGLSDKPVQTSGSIFPGLDMTVGASGVNDIISTITGTGALGNLVLGKVMPNFYLKLQLLESNGALKVRSTPKLSTLNGHEASLSIGTTEYYLETQNTVVGTQNPQNIASQQYKSVNADLSVSINPFVSGDEQITLDIKVKQSDFTDRISPSAPPGKTTRDFESMLRVKNEETILLGGLEESRINDTGRGVPGLSRVPVLKWLFSDRNKTRAKSKLILLIKPTVLY
jgi:type IV pilus assembly protein PilQ